MITNLKLTQYRKMRLNKKTKKNLIKKYNLTKTKKRQLLHCSVKKLRHTLGFFNSGGNMSSMLKC
jgi:hypothetical protein